MIVRPRRPARADQSRHGDNHPSHRGQPDRVRPLRGGRAHHHRCPPARPGLARGGPEQHRPPPRGGPRVPPRGDRGHGPARRARSTAPFGTGSSWEWRPPSPPACTRRRRAPSSPTYPASSSPAPLPIVRGLRVSAVQDGGHPQERHVFLWFLAVDPDHQRRGIGPGAASPGVRGRPCPRLPGHRQPRQPPLLRELRLRGDRQRRAAARGSDVVHEASLRRWASGSPSSFFSVLFSIWRIRSRVTPKARPTSSSVRALWPVRP